MILSIFIVVLVRVLSLLWKLFQVFGKWKYHRVRWLLWWTGIFVLSRPSCRARKMKQNFFWRTLLGLNRTYFLVQNRSVYVKNGQISHQKRTLRKAISIILGLSLLISLDIGFTAHFVAFCERWYGCLWFLTGLGYFCGVILSFLTYHVLRAYVIKIYTDSKFHTCKYIFIF